MRAALDQIREVNMSNKEEIELREAIANLTEEDEYEMPAKKIKVKQLPPDDHIRVNIIPNHETIVKVLRDLDDEEFKEVVRAAKQYRKADKILYKV